MVIYEFIKEKTDTFKKYSKNKHCTAMRETSIRWGQGNRASNI